jgi:hypothetical protein
LLEADSYRRIEFLSQTQKKTKQMMFPLKERDLGAEETKEYRDNLDMAHENLRDMGAL